MKTVPPSSGKLEVVDLCASYGRVQVTWDINVEVLPGQRVALIGPNGAGKTSIIRAIAGLMRINSGSIRCGGVRLPERPDQIARSGIVTVLEGRRLFPSLTVHENLLLPLAIRKKTIPRRLWPERVGRAYEIFPALVKYRDWKTGQLSGGQQQMVAIGRGLVVDVSFLLLDEPSMGLAPAAAEAVFAGIARIADETGAGIILAEQNGEAALELAHRAFIVDRGRTGAPEDAQSLLRDTAKLRKAYLGGQ